MIVNLLFLMDIQMKITIYKDNLEKILNQIEDESFETIWIIIDDTDFFNKNIFPNLVRIKTKSGIIICSNRNHKVDFSENILIIGKQLEELIDQIQCDHEIVGIEFPM